MVSKQCPVSRAAYCYIQMRPVNMPSVLQNGRLGAPQQAMEQQVMQVWAQHHELRIYGDPFNHELYCVFCGEIASQHDWVEAASRPANA